MNNAPYSHKIHDFNRASEIIVCVGISSLNMAKQKHWFHDVAKLALPFGVSPFDYNWPVRGRSVMIIGRESKDLLIDLSGCLLEDGATSVLWIVEGLGMTKVGRNE